jgi:hypothetical protein
MSDALIVRKAGVAALRTLNPSINFVSKTGEQIVVTFTNNDAAEAEVFYGLTAPLTDTVTLATTVTSSNITLSGLDVETQYTVSAYALVTDPTSKKIKSEIVSTTITTDGPSYTAATGGTTEEYDDGGKRYKSHTFTSNGTFEVTAVGDSAGDRNQVDYLIIAGGGGGGSQPDASDCGLGGGGAGGYRTTFGTQGGLGTLDPKPTVSIQTYDVTVGSGGSADTTGSNSLVNFSSSVTSLGGGRGANASSAGSTTGGSGGGAAGRGSLINQRSLGTENQGFPGGLKNVESNLGTGGGGAGQEPSTNSSTGGDGIASIIRTGSSETRGGGGGGGISLGTAGVGGLGGGGNGGGNANGSPGTANTGGGGGGAGRNTDSRTGGAGGSGLVIIRYEIEPSV